MAASHGLRRSRGCAESSEPSQDATSSRYSWKACGDWSIAAMTRPGIAVVNGTGTGHAPAHGRQGRGCCRKRSTADARARPHRHRAHALGHAWRAQRAQRASACVARRPGGGAQRHHRELRGAARRTEGRRATQFASETDTEVIAHRIHYHMEHAGRPVQGRARHRRGTGRRLRAGGAERARAGPADPGARWAARW